MLSPWAPATEMWLDLTWHEPSPHQNGISRAGSHHSSITPESHFHLTPTMFIWARFYKNLGWWWKSGCLPEELNISLSQFSTKALSSFLQAQGSLFQAGSYYQSKAVDWLMVHRHIQSSFGRLISSFILSYMKKMERGYNFGRFMRTGEQHKNWRVCLKNGLHWEPKTLQKKSHSCNLQPV